MPPKNRDIHFYDKTKMVLSTALSNIKSELALP